MNTTGEIYNNLNDEIIQEIEKLAGLFFTPREICIVMGWNFEFIEEFENLILTMDYQNPIYKAYQKGRLVSEVELRESIKQAALNGSNPAQTTLIDFYNKSKI